METNNKKMVVGSFVCFLSFFRLPRVSCVHSGSWTAARNMFFFSLHYFDSFSSLFLFCVCFVFVCVCFVFVLCLFCVCFVLFCVCFVFVLCLFCVCCFKYPQFLLLRPLLRSPFADYFFRISDFFAVFVVFC